MFNTIANGVSLAKRKAVTLPREVIRLRKCGARRKPGLGGVGHLSDIAVAREILEDARGKKQRDAKRLAQKSARKNHSRREAHAKSTTLTHAEMAQEMDSLAGLATYSGKWKN